MAALGFLAASTMIRAVLPFPEVSPITAKLRFAQAHRTDIDTVFFGSSRVNQQLSPALFDETMRTGGRPTHSFNFGVNGMFLGEEDYLVDQLMELPGGKLRWVFVEVGPLQLKFDPTNAGAKRTAYWHDWTRTQALFQEIFKADAAGRRKGFWGILWGRPGKRKMHDLFVLHLSLFAKNFANVGAGRDLMDQFRHRSEPPEQSALGPDSDGYHPIRKQLAPEKIPGYEKALATANGTRTSQPLDRATEDVCRRCAQEIRRHGAIPIFIVTPILDQSRLTFSDPATAPAAILSFNDSGLYPELYRGVARIDLNHLNELGSADFTRRLAEEFASALRTGAIK